MLTPVTPEKFNNKIGCDNLKTNLKTKFAIAYLVMTIVGQLMVIAFLSLSAGCALHREWVGWFVAATLTMAVMFWWQKAIDRIGDGMVEDENDE